jgi:hypothetical protein
MSNSTTFPPVTPRDLIMAIEPMLFRDRLKAVFCLVGKQAGLHPRMVRAAWIGEPVSPQVVKKLQKAAAEKNATRTNALDLAAQLDALAISLRAVDASRGGTCGDVFDETASHLRRAAGALRDVARP